MNIAATGSERRVRDQTKPHDGKRKAYVSIYCKIYTENFSDEMLCRQATGQEIYEFLMKDAGMYVDERSQPLPGDLNIWYLGTNEKFGSIAYQDTRWTWSFGESSFDIVEAFVRAVHEDGLFTHKQYETLLDTIREGREIKDMYAIGNHLYRIRNDQKRKEKRHHAV